MHWRHSSLHKLVGGTGPEADQPQQDHTQQEVSHHPQPQPQLQEESQETGLLSLVIAEIELDISTMVSSARGSNAAACQLPCSLRTSTSVCYNGVIQQRMHHKQGMMVLCCSTLECNCTVDQAGSCWPAACKNEQIDAIGNQRVLQRANYQRYQQSPQASC